MLTNHAAITRAQQAVQPSPASGMRHAHNAAHLLYRTPSAPPDPRSIMYLKLRLAMAANVRATRDVSELYASEETLLVSFRQRFAFPEAEKFGSSAQLKLKRL